MPRPKPSVRHFSKADWAASLATRRRNGLLLEVSAEAAEAALVAKAEAAEATTEATP